MTSLSKEEIEKLYKKNIKLVYKMANRYVKNTNPLFDDLVQEGSIGFLDALNSYDPEKAALSTYVCRHIFWKMAVFLKKENKMTTCIEFYDEKDDIPNEEINSYSTDVLEMSKGVYKEILYYKFWHNYSLQDIGKKLKLPPRAIYSLYQEALENFKECLNEN